MDKVFQSSSGYFPALAAAMPPSWLSGSSLWLHLATVVLLAVGLVVTLRMKTPRPHGVERMIPFGRMLYAVPLGLFGLQHFVFLNEVKGGVPSYMPWHIFWACLVGVALIAACLSILTGIKADLAALLMGIMLFLFVLMIYAPNLAANLHDRFAISGPFRDLAMSGGALALAGTLGATGHKQWNGWLVKVGRCFFAASMLCFGVDHFLHPDFAPGVPTDIPMPAWIPSHLVLAYAMGAVLVVCGGCILLNKGARIAAAWLGVAFLLLLLFIYLPMEIVHPSVAISGELDQIAEKLAMSGAALLVAGAMPAKKVQAT